MQIPTCYAIINFHVKKLRIHNHKAFKAMWHTDIEICFAPILFFLLFNLQFNDNIELVKITFFNAMGFFFFLILPF